MCGAVLNVLDLSPELLHNILSQLSKEEQKVVALCCKKLKNVVQPLIWLSIKVRYNKLSQRFNRHLVALCQELTLQRKSRFTKGEVVMDELCNDNEEIIKGLRMLISSCNPLKLHLCYSPVMSHTSHDLSHMDRLRELYLEHELTTDLSFSDKEVDTIFSSCAPQLKLLSIVDSANTEKAYVNIGRFTCLETLNVRGSGITDRVLKDIRSFPLRELNISESHGLTDDGMRYVSLLRELEILHVSASPKSAIRTSFIGDKGVEHLASLSNLRELWLCSNKGVTDMSLVHISSLCKLQRLDLFGTSVTDNGLLLLRKLKKLGDLNLGACDNVFGRTLSQLSELPLSCLRLPYTLVTDESLKELHLFDSLVFVDLWNCPYVSDKSMEYLAKVKSLENLDIQGTSVSELGYFHFIRYHPKDVDVCDDFDDEVEDRYEQYIKFCSFGFEAYYNGFEAYYDDIDSNGESINSGSSDESTSNESEEDVDDDDV